MNEEMGQASREERLGEILNAFFDVVPRFKRRFRTTGSKLLQEKGLTSVHMHVLIALEHGEKMSMSRAAEVLGIAKPNLSVSVEKLVEDGYVARSIDPEDRRGINICICPEGREVLAAYRNETKKRLVKAMSSWSEEDLDSLSQILKNMNALMEKLNLEEN